MAKLIFRRVKSLLCKALLPTIFGAFEKVFVLGGVLFSFFNAEIFDIFIIKII